MPELPEVETVRRMLEGAVVGLRVAAVRVSGARLREPVSRTLPRRLAGRRVLAAGRVGKYLLLDFEGGNTLLAHLGMSGRLLFFPARPATRPPHVHARFEFEDGAQLWFQDARRFGLLKLLPTDSVRRSPHLARLGPDPLAQPPERESLYRATRNTAVSAKTFLMDQRRVAGLGNIYASEILYRARVHPVRRARSLRPAECAAIAEQTTRVLEEAVRYCGTTFSDYATLWGEPGAFGSFLRVYDRAGEPCRECGATIRRVVQGQRSTFFCPRCQKGRPRGRPG